MQSGRVVAQEQVCLSTMKTQLYAALMDHLFEQ